MEVNGITVVKMRIKVLNDYDVLPVILFPEEGFLVSHLKYLYVMRGKSKSWLEKNAFSIVLFMQFTLKHENDFEKKSELFCSFKDHLELGTIDSNGNDESGLRWSPRSKSQIKEIIYHINQYTEHRYNEVLEKTGDKEIAKKTLVNPYKKASHSEKMASLLAYHNRKKRAFLSHTFDDEKALKKAEKSRDTVVYDDNTDEKTASPFPEQYIWSLINSFRLKGAKDSDPIENRINLRDALITLILHFTGLRVSEPFHLYVDDIIVNPTDKDSILIKIHHPANSIAPEKDYTNRKDYLNKKFFLNPRNEKKNSKSYYSGWKGMKLNKKGVRILYWFESEVGKVFMQLWKLYLEHQRVWPNHQKNHPFAFTNKYGRPASLSKYLQAHQIAVKKLGLEYSESHGTTPHCHRHAYGNKLENSGVEPLIIKEAMGHISLESQMQYKHPTNEQIREKLLNQEQLIINKHAQNMNQGKGLVGDYRDVDPLELLSGKNRLKAGI
jgi:site-specific recombinase XerD